MGLLLQRFALLHAIGAHVRALGQMSQLGTSGEPPLYGFNDLCTSEFVTESWSQKSSMMKPGLEAVGSLFDMSDLTSLILAANGSVQVAGGTATVAGQTSSVSPQPKRRKGTAADFFRNCSLALSGIEAKLPRLAKWSRAFARTFGITIEVNLYLTPPSSQAFSLHNDKQDVLAAQVSGSKTWKIWDLHGGIELPEDMGIKPVAHPFHQTVALLKTDAPALEAMPIPSLNAHVTPGSLLYVPRGSLHVASTAEYVSSSSLHLTIGVLTQMFSFAFVLFHVSTEDELQKIIELAGWSLHDFRKTLMDTAGKAVEGVDFRQSLPVGFVWWAHNRTQGLLCRDGLNESPFSEAHARAETLLARILGKAPLPPEEQPKLSLSLLQSAAGVFVRHLEKYDKDLIDVSDLPLTAPIVAIELPEELHISFTQAVTGDEVDVHFAWCQGDAKHSAADAIEVQWPPLVLSMLEVIAKSQLRRISLIDLGGGPDPVPKHVFAVMLATLPLNPSIQLVSQSIEVLDSRPRSPDCVPHGLSRTTASEL